MSIKEYLTQLLILSNLDKASFTVDEITSDRRIYLDVNVTEDVAGYFIGAKGETLEALQQIVRITFRDEEKQIVVDINHYKKEREEALLAKAAQIAEQLVVSKQSYQFFNLNSYERFIIHDFISNSEQYKDVLETKSYDSDTGRVLEMMVKANA